MNIAVLNGSPKGEQSVTMQYVHFLQTMFPQHTFRILNVAQRLKKLESNAQAFQETIEQIRSADGVLWAFPVYILLVHAQYKRFIELIWERHVQEVFRDKYAAALSTSIHFYDHTAHNYIHGICDDLNMRYLDFYSAEMMDLKKEGERQRFLQFAEHVFSAIEQAAPTFKRYAPVIHETADYVPGEVNRHVDTKNQKVVIVADIEAPQSNLAKMVARCREVFSGDVEVFNIRELDIKGSCLGCMRCAYDNTCAWEGKDAYIAWYSTKFKPADVIIFAGTIHDRYLSARWKMVFDRGFFNTHIPVLRGKQFGFILSGPLRQIPNLREIFEAQTEVQQANLVDIATDESGDSGEIDGRLEQMAVRLIQYAEEQYLRPLTFLQVGGMKIFRDGVYGNMRVIFRADHRFYKTHGVYDFPQKHYATRALNAVAPLLFKLPAFRKRFYTKEIKPGMIRPLQKIVQEAQPHTS